MKKEFNLLQLFTVVDGRLATEMGDVYDILNHVLDDNFYTHQLPVAMNYIMEKKPEWFIDVQNRLENIKKELKTDDFEKMIAYIRFDNNPTYYIPQLKEEQDISDLYDFMINNSLLLKR